MKEKPRIPLWRWSLWMTMLAAALVLFYGILTPLWMLLRLVAWLSEHRALRRDAEAAQG
ncbi:MAG: hypothetical protein ICV74_10365 [Thermoleophilia bacterium]|nr:hypothetical protein [Thermoleophilia bacterium]